MANWYMKGQSEYVAANFHMGFYIDHSGFAEGDYNTQDMETHGATSDPFMAFGIDTGPATWTYGQQQTEIGLLKSHRIKIDTTGCYKWVGPGQDDWGLLEAAGAAGNLGDLDDVVITGTPADNELLAWDTSTSKWINQTSAEAGLALVSELHTEDHDNAHHTTNYHTETDGTGVATVHSDIADTGSQSIITTAERNALHAIYTLESHNNTYHSVTFITALSEDSTPQLGGTLDLNGKGITAELTAGESFTAGIIGYVKDDGKIWKAKADVEATCDTRIVMATESISGDATGTFLLVGAYTTTGLTAGSEYWVDPTTAGTFTTTKPSTTGHIIRHIGTALSTTVFFFDPDKTYVEYV